MRKLSTKRDFGKKLYDTQRKAANFKEGSLLRAKHPKGKV